MKISNLMKGALVASAVMISANSFAQIQDEKNVTVTMELVPILQLNMNTPDQVNFVFDEISEYIGGITKYGATILTASSTVSWDLFASGTSGAHMSDATTAIWDAQVAYGAASGVDALPLRALELRQFPTDINNDSPATAGDYGAPFAPVATPAYLNNIYVSAGSPYLAPPGTENEDRYIAGGDGLASFVAGGSYLTELGVAQGGLDADGDANSLNAYYFVIDYRIIPGLPAVFPHASDGDGATAGTAFINAGTGEYAQPGVYTMNVKYLMIENQ